MNRRTLGRGLQALLGIDETLEHAPSAEMDRSMEQPSGLLHLALDEIELNPYQPRREFDSEELAELTKSIQSHGVIQPILVRQVHGHFQLVAGERRLRASRAAGLSHVPARLIDIDDRKTFEIALIENLQRKDLNAVEKAKAFRNYLDQFKCTHEQLAEQLGVDRSTVTNMVRLLELPDPVLEAVVSGKITFGHARALLTVGDSSKQLTLCQRIISEQLSVRQTEAVAKERDEPTTETPAMASEDAPTSVVRKSHHVESLENELRQHLATKVEIRTKAKDNGAIVIHFASNDDFERVIQLLIGDRGL